MPSDPTENLTELELDSLWTIYEGYSLVIERPVGGSIDPYAHAVMAVSYDDGEAVADVAEIPLDAAENLIAQGYLVLSEDGPVLDENEWFDEELDTQIEATEYVLSEKGEAVINATADGDVGLSALSSDDDDDLDDDWDDDLDGDDLDDDWDDELDEFGEDDDDWDDIEA